VKAGLRSEARLTKALRYPVELKVDVDQDAIDEEGGWQVIDPEVVSAVP
jgi:hypothetical protein